MATGNEFQQPGDKGINQRAEQGAESNLQRESQERVAVTGYDAAKQHMQHHCGDMHGFMSMSTDPKGFETKTAELLAQTPEKMAEAIKAIGTQAEALKTFMASAEQKIANVLRAQAAQEGIERANRMA